MDRYIERWGVREKSGCVDYVMGLPLDVLSSF